MFWIFASSIGDRGQNKKATVYFLMEAVSDDALERTIQIGQQGFQGKTT